MTRRQHGDITICIYQNRNPRPSALVTQRRSDLVNKELEEEQHRRGWARDAEMAQRWGQLEAIDLKHLHHYDFLKWDCPGFVERQHTKYQRWGQDASSIFIIYPPRGAEGHWARWTHPFLWQSWRWEGMTDIPMNEVKQTICKAFRRINVAGVNPCDFLLFPPMDEDEQVHYDEAARDCYARLYAHRQTTPDIGWHLKLRVRVLPSRQERLQHGVTLPPGLDQ